MNQGILSEISLITSLIFSLSALALSVLTFRIQRTESSYSDVDKAYFDILKLAIQYPSLRDIAQTQTYYERPEGDPYRIQYESYAFIAWNVVETIFDRQGDKSARFGVSSTWLPVIMEENRLHYHWFCRNLRLFKAPFQEFVMAELNNLSVHEGTAGDLEAIFPLLQRDFPPEELKSHAQFERLMAHGEYKLYLATHATLGTTFGYALMFEPKSPRIAWLDYIAIDPRFRNTGFGTAFFQRMCEMLKADRSGIMLEVEPATSSDEATLAIQQRRIAFYKRLSAKQLDVEYVFPTEGKPYPLLLFYRPIRKASVLRAEDIQAMIRAAYSYIHNDVENRGAILQTFVDKVRDQPL